MEGSTPKRVGRGKGSWRALEPHRDDWLRLAAFIDGEGSILISRKGYQDNGRIRMWLRVILVNTDPRLPKWCLDTFGGTLVFEKRRNPKHRDALRWHVNDEQAEWIVRGCLPYFLIKKEEADIAIAFRETFHGPRKCMSDQHAAFAIRNQLRNQLHELKRSTPLFRKISDEVAQETVN